MRIAIATDKGMVSSHFGRCPEFTIIEIKDNKIIRKDTIKNPGHETGFLPRFFNERGIGCIITGGAGFRAKQLFDEFNIRLVTGLGGRIEDVVNDFINKKIRTAENLCAPGKGKGYGLEKQDKTRKNSEEGELRK